MSISHNQLKKQWLPPRLLPLRDFPKNSLMTTSSSPKLGIPIIKRQLLLPSSCTAIAATNDRTYFIAGSQCGILKIQHFPPDSEPTTTTFNFGNSALNAIEVTKDAAVVFAGTEDGHLKIVSLKNGGNSRSVEETGPVGVLTKHPSEQYIFLAVNLEFKNHHKGNLKEFAVCRDGSVLASAGSEGAIQLWDLRVGKEVQTLSDPHAGYAVNNLRFSQDQQTLLSNGCDNVTRCWDLRTCAEVQRFQSEAPHGSFFMNSDQWIALCGSEIVAVERKTGFVVGRCGPPFLGNERKIVFEPDHCLVGNAEGACRLLCF